ncbi:MAG: flagellar basal body rod protein FlgC [Myxococcales bacterium]|nr:flagellar basal body rod protein FlgC [Myxococcales bacterium]
MSLSVFKAIELSGRALSIQRTRLDMVSANLANTQTTRTPEGGPYRRQNAILASDVAREPFGEMLRNELGEPIQTVALQEVVADPAPPRMVYDPGHPDANPAGYVAMPNINAVEEMVDLVTIMRSYQANLSAFSSLQEMANRSLTIGRGS